jgi:hypothetical protein
MPTQEEFDRHFIYLLSQADIIYINNMIRISIVNNVKPIFLCDITCRRIIMSNHFENLFRKRFEELSITNMRMLMINVVRNLFEEQHLTIA